jgi:hypothetical protein
VTNQMESIIEAARNDPRAVRAYVGKVTATSGGLVDIDVGDGPAADVHAVPCVGMAPPVGTEVLVLTFDREIWAISGGGTAAGVVHPFAGTWTTTPTGFLPCDGSAQSRSAFPTLFAAIGTTYGAGDGSTTFNLPNVPGLAADPHAYLNYIIST